MNSEVDLYFDGIIKFLLAIHVTSISHVSGTSTAPAWQPKNVAGSAFLGSTEHKIIMYFWESVQSVRIYLYADKLFLYFRWLSQYIKEEIKLGIWNFNLALSVHCSQWLPKIWNGFLPKWCSTRPLLPLCLVSTCSCVVLLLGSKIYAQLHSASVIYLNTAHFTSLP